jgi:regulator of sigma E protease
MASNIVVGMALVLGVLILVHEWGHFIIARWCGVRVDVFSIGFGPRLFGIKRGATDYRVSAFPLGGYVRMAGQDPSEVDSSSTAALPTGASDELMSKTRWQRALISFAGPAVNLVFPVLLLTGFFYFIGKPYPAYLDKAIQVVALPTNSSTAANFPQLGDKISAVNGEKVATWGEADEALGRLKPGEEVQLEVVRNGITISVKSVPPGPLQADRPFGYAPILPIVDAVEDGRPAKRAGLKEDDLVVAADGQKIHFWEQFVEQIRRSGGKPVQMEVERGGKTVNLTITPELGPSESGQMVYQIGISQKDVLAYKHIPFSQCAREGWLYTSDFTGKTVGVLGKLVSGKVSVKQLQSVVGISRAAGHAVHRGPLYVTLLMAFMSVNLGILNLLPIPILDGGNILLLTLEGIRRRDFSMSFKERFVQVGLVFLLVLFVIVMYNDVKRILPFQS